MNKSAIVGLSVAAALGFLVLFIGSSWLGAANTGAQIEAGITATQNNNKQILGQYTTKIAEMAQVPAMARDDLTEAMTKALDARYGEEGSQAMFQVINENYPGQIDSQLYRNIQTEMASGRTAFTNNQTILLDKKRIYETKLNQPVSGFWMHLAGYPKLDLDNITVVTSTAAARAFETGIDDGVTLRREPAPVTVENSGGKAG